MTPLLTLFFMTLAALAATKMWSDSDIFRPLRNKMSDYKLLHKPWLCAKCMSFWMGLAASFVIGDPFLQLGVVIGVSSALCGLVVHFIASILIDKEIF